MKLCNI
jgi:hypothetical protein